MQLLTLLKAVKEQTLSLNQLEDYHTELSNLYADMEIELGDLEKKEAIYIYESTEPTDIAKTRKWKVTPEGQRLILLKRYEKATGKVLQSMKRRLYKLYV